jgi:enoyl-CoA hydratase/carnithine racemase
MMDNIPPSDASKVTIETRDRVVLIGINRPYIHNRIDPETFYGLAKAYFDYDNDPSLRAAVLFGHGPNFSQGNDVDAYAALAQSGRAFVLDDTMIDPLGKARRLSKPLIVVTHGDCWNMGHEIHLAADIRVASADTRFGQDEASHGRFPGGGATIRFVREAGWANAMRYMLTGDHWNADEAYRMGEVQHVAADSSAALSQGLAIAAKVAQCAPLGIATTLASAHLAIDGTEEAAFAKLNEQYGALYRTDDFIEGRKAEAENRPPHYQGR